MSLPLAIIWILMVRKTVKMMRRDWIHHVCFMCVLEDDSIENCMIHMHKQHGFFIPDVEYSKDPESLLTYLGLKVKRDFMCLYCNDLCHPFSSLEAVRKHMAAKGSLQSTLWRWQQRSS
ncbi:hypothetical protein SLA2020_220090 [Shorea laevis]